MATTETPPNSTSAPPPPSPPEEQAQPIKVQAGRFGELGQDELIHLLDSYDDERSKGRFRESIYISIIIYLALAWLAVWGPRVLFHQGTLITSKDQLHNKISTLDLPKMPKAPPKIVPKNPVIDQKTMDKIKAMQPAPRPLPPAPAPPPPAPAPETPTPAPPTPPPPAPTPQVQPKLPSQPQPSNAIPDAPKPNFNVSRNAGDSIRDAARNAANAGRGSSISGGGHAVGRDSAADSGLEMLTDPENVDFGPYLRHLLAMVKASWYPLIPEECYPPLSKEGKTLIRFSIDKNGVLTANGMHLEDSTHDVAIDKAAWGSLTSIGQFPPLPAEFKGPRIELRIQFIISRVPQRDR